MRTQAITTPLDDSGDPAEWRAEAVDPRGWLAGAGSTSAVPRADADRTDGPSAGTPDRATVRTARRNAGARRRRRVPTHRTSRSLVVDPAIALTADSAEPTRSAAAVGGSEVDGYRMGRWARLTLTITVLAAIAVVTVSLMVGSAPRALVDVTVGPGDTLWSIANQAAPDRDPREVIEEIRALNLVPSDVLPVGIVLRVPSSVE